MLTPLDIKEIMIEITSNCQAMCLDCGRNLDGVKLNPNLQFGTAGNMKFETFKSVFNKKVLPNFDKTHFDGNFGDSMIHPESLEFVKYLAKEFPGSRIEINTNGGYHDPEYWYEMGQITSKNFRNDEQVLFGIDGIDNETHDKYRRNVKYDRIIENATAFIKGGGKAVWKYLEFDHNAHQVDEAKQLAKKMGFVHFFVKSTRWRSKAILGETTISGSASKKHDETQISTIPKTQQDYVNKIQTNLKKFKDFNSILEYIGKKYDYNRKTDKHKVYKILRNIIIKIHETNINLFNLLNINNYECLFLTDKYYDDTNNLTITN